MKSQSWNRISRERKGLEVMFLKTICDHFYIVDVNNLQYRNDDE